VTIGGSKALDVGDLFMSAFTDTDVTHPDGPSGSLPKERDLDAPPGGTASDPVNTDLKRYMAAGRLTKPKPRLWPDADLVRQSVTIRLGCKLFLLFI
jgi:hypothetical protein